MAKPKEYPRDRADRCARDIARRAQAGLHERLVTMIRDGDIPDVGFLKLEDMAKTLAGAAVNPSYNIIMKNYEADDWVDDDPNERDA